MSGAPTELKKNCLVFVLAITKMSQVIKRKEEPNQGVKEAAMTPVNQGRELRRVGWVREKQRMPVFDYTLWMTFRP